jgi:hypothetical protein
MLLLKRQFAKWKIHSLCQEIQSQDLSVEQPVAIALYTVAVIIISSLSGYSNF